MRVLVGACGCACGCGRAYVRACEDAHMTLCARPCACVRTHVLTRVRACEGA